MLKSTTFKHTKLVETLLSEKGLPISTFEDALVHAASLYKNIPIEQSERIKVAAAISYQNDGSLCDLGSAINLYPIVLKFLGMRVTTVDYYPNSTPDHPNYSPDIQRGLDIYRSVGIQAIESDIYDFAPAPETFDVITSFQTFEHLWHSPKPIMENMVLSLKRQGAFIISLPNIAQLLNRLKLIAGQSPFESFPNYFEHGNPYTGHRREMTISEVHWMMTAMGLKKSKLFATNICVPLGKSAKASARFYSLFLDIFPMPHGLRRCIYAVYKKE
jgi:SAM-dependent methyltransferase